MKIKEVCEKTRLTERTVRFYMEKGLVSPKTEWINGRNYTDFSDKDVETLNSVAVLREMTFSIEEILLMQKDPSSIYETVKNKREYAKKSSEAAQNAFYVLDSIDAENIRSVTALANMAKEAMLSRPHDLPLSAPPEINESGMGERCGNIPQEIEGKWNWGAFLFPVIWGLVNRVYQALLCLIPIFGIFYAFYLGKHGNELAWRGRYWESVSIFRKTQRIWALVSCIVAIAQIALGIGAAIAQHSADKQHEKDVISLAGQLTFTQEWGDTVGSRTEWTEENDQTHAYAENDQDTYTLEEAIEQCINTYISIPDPFYAEDRYYRILMSDSFGLGVSAADDEAGAPSSVYTAIVELSDGTAWSFSCDVDEDNTITDVDVNKMEEHHVPEEIYAGNYEKAAEHMREYLEKRYDEVVSSDIFKETVGSGYSVIQIAPQLASTADIYEGNMPVLKGILLTVKAADGQKYHAAIDVEYDEKTDTDIERELYVIPAAS